MTLIEWKDDYAVNIAEIDRQHEKLADIINKFEDAMRAEKEKEALSGIIDDLVDYSKVHFQTEEKYMSGFTCAEADLHKVEHERFNEEVCRFIREFKNPSDDLPRRIAEFLKDWWFRHIRIEDRIFSQKKSGES